MNTSASASESSLLASNEPAPYRTMNLSGKSSFVLVCDHASNLVPESLKALGLSKAMLNSHIGWDIGAAQVAEAMAGKLDAPLVLSNYSRLVIDCNRPLSSPQSIPESSAGIIVPGNQSLTPAQKQQRIGSLFEPYHQAIDHLLAQRQQRTILVSIHSFTPELNGEKRPWQVGISYYHEPRLAKALHAALQSNHQSVVGFNQPYAIETEFDYTVPVQGEGNGLPSAMIEMRQNEISTSNQVVSWANTLAQALEEIESTV